MRLSIKSSGKKTYFYVLDNVTKNKKSTSYIFEKLGTPEEIMEKYNCDDPEAWAREHVARLNEEKKNKDHKVLVPLYTDVRIVPGEQQSFNVGYLILQRIYYRLGIPYMCKKISERHGFEYDLDAVLSRLVYGRILFPSSKLSCFEQSKGLFEQPSFELQHIYRALSVLSEESDFIQERLYRNSAKIIRRQTGVLYYDCTNYYFEIEQEDDLRRYGRSKENRPNPIVQMGLFMDRSGMPLAFCINPGSTNEQVTMRPLEEQIMRDFDLSKFVICTDAGLSSASNRMFNNFGERSYVTAHSLKTHISAELREWALSPEGWSLKGHKDTFRIDQLEDTPEESERIYYKQRYIEGYDKERDIPFNETLVVTYSKKYADYQRSVREKQVARAAKIAGEPSRADRKGSNDVRRFIKKTAVTGDGEIAEHKIYEVDQALIDEEAKYDGFYAVYTNLDDDPSDIAQISHARWKIEESFRIMKHEFEARPVFVRREDRIKAHFLTCFMALLIYRILDRQLDGRYTCEQIVHTLEKMNVTKAGGEGYIPAYTRTELTDALHDNAGFHTDYQIMTEKTMKGICRRSKGL